jgi:RNA polymerase sigma-70 factor (ECF subfamily)
VYVRAVTYGRPESARSLDDLLVAVGRDHDRAAFGELFRAVAPKVKAYLLRGGADEAKADELVQDVMLTVWRRADTFDPRRAAATTWIFAIARNRRIDALRREKHPEVDPRDPALEPAPSTSAEGAIDASRAGAAVRGALRMLPPEQAAVLVGAYFEDRTLAAIAERDQVPLGTVKSRVRLALERLRGALGGGS